MKKMSDLRKFLLYSNISSKNGTNEKFKSVKKLKRIVEMDNSLSCFFRIIFKFTYVVDIFF